MIGIWIWMNWRGHRKLTTALHATLTGRHLPIHVWGCCGNPQPFKQGYSRVSVANRQKHLAALRPSGPGPPRAAPSLSSAVAVSEGGDSGHSRAAASCALTIDIAQCELVAELRQGLHSLHAAQLAVFHCRRGASDSATASHLVKRASHLVRGSGDTPPH